MKMQLNTPPNWPTPPQGWTPPAGWQPDPAWGSPPMGWPLWLAEPDNRSTGKSHYGLLALSVGICLIGSLVLIQIGKSMGSDDFLSQLGWSPVLVAPKLHQLMRRRFAPDQPDTSQRPGHSVGLSIIYGALIFATALQVAGALAGYAAAASGDFAANYVPVAFPVILVTMVTTIGLIGMSAGVRVTRHSWAVPVVSAVLGEFLGLLLGMMVNALGLDTSGLIEELLTAETVAQGLVIALAIGLIVGVPATLIGRKLRFAAPPAVATVGF